MTSLYNKTKGDGFLCVIVSYMKRVNDGPEKQKNSVGPMCLYFYMNEYINLIIYQVEVILKSAHLEQGTWL